jgi:hypothetical protein
LPPGKAIFQSGDQEELAKRPANNLVCQFFATLFGKIKALFVAGRKKKWRITRK